MQKEVKQLEDKSDKVTFVTDFEGEEFCIVKIPPALGLKPEIVKISSKVTDLSETEKDKILAEKNKAINLDIYSNSFKIELLKII